MPTCCLRILNCACFVINVPQKSFALIENIWKLGSLGLLLWQCYLLRLSLCTVIRCKNNKICVFFYTNNMLIFFVLCIFMSGDVWLCELHMVIQGFFLWYLPTVFVAFMWILCNKMFQSFCTLVFCVAPSNVSHLYLLHMSAAETGRKDPTMNLTYLIF